MPKGANKSANKPKAKTTVAASASLAPAKGRTSNNVIADPKHFGECKILSGLFSQYIPQYFGAFEHTADEMTCFNSQVATVLKHAVENWKVSEEIITFCAKVNHIYEEYGKKVNKSNPFFHASQNYIRSHFENLKRGAVENEDIAGNIVRCLGLFYANSMLTDPMIKVCLSTFLKLAESKTSLPFLLFYCSLLSQIKPKLMKINPVLLDVCIQRLYTFVTSTKEMNLHQLPSYIMALLKTPNTLALAAAPAPTIAAAPKKQEHVDFDNFIGLLTQFKNQICASSPHSEQFYAEMIRTMFEWQRHRLRGNENDADALKLLCKSEISLLRSHVDMFRRKYKVKLTSGSNEMLVERGELKILKRSYLLRSRILDSIKYMADFYNTNFVENDFVMECLQFSLGYDTVSNCSLECALQLLFYIMPKLITSTESGPMMVKFVIGHVQKIVKAAKSTTRVKYMLIETIKTINRCFPYMHIENELCPKQAVACPIRTTFNASFPLW